MDVHINLQIKFYIIYHLLNVYIFLKFMCDIKELYLHSTKLYAHKLCYKEELQLTFMFMIMIFKYIHTNFNFMRICKNATSIIRQ